MTRALLHGTRPNGNASNIPVLVAARFSGGGAPLGPDRPPLPVPHHAPLPPPPTRRRRLPPQSENEQLKKMLEEKAMAAMGDVPDFLIAQHIERNKDALAEDLKEAAEHITDLRQARALPMQGLAVE